MLIIIEYMLIVMVAFINMLFKGDIMADKSYNRAKLIITNMNDDNCQWFIIFNNYVIDNRGQIYVKDNGYYGFRVPKTKYENENTINNI